MLRIALVLVLAGASGAVALEPAPRDLDVSLPPGSPLEWLRELRQPVATGRGGVPTRPGETSHDGPGQPPPPPPGGPRETSDGVPAPPPADDGRPGQTVAANGLEFVAANPFAYARITTFDIAGHLRWTVPTPGSLRTDTPTGSGADPAWSYPPLPSDTMYWFALSAYLRWMLHPAALNRHELVAYLVELGEPALIPGGIAVDDPSVRELYAEVKRYVTPLPATAPKVRAGRDPVESMLYRVATEELTSGFVYELNPYFAWRTCSFGSRMHPILSELSASEHSFLARNAAAVYAASTAPGADLLRIAESTRDHVVQARLVSGLLRRRYAPARALLEKLAGSEEPSRAVRGLHGLGQLGDPAALPAILAAARRRPKDPDILQTAVSAIGRLGKPDPDALRFLRDVLKLAEQGTFSGPARDPDLRKGPDFPDPEDLRSQVLRQHALVALARVGDRDSVEAVFREFEKAPEPPDPRRGARRPALSAVLQPFQASTLYQLVELLGGLAIKGPDRLKSLVASRSEDPALQIAALDLLVGPRPEKPAYVLDIADDDTTTPGLRALALVRAAEGDAVGAAKVAKRLVDAYADSPVPPLPAPGDFRHWAEPDPSAGISYLVTTSMTLLGRLGKNDPDLLLKTIERATKDLQRDEKIAKQPAPPPDQRWFMTRAVVVKAPVLQTAIHELGRTGHAEGGARLIKILGNPDLKVGRAEAALALGMVKTAGVDKALLKALEDKVGWVRWCASRALSARHGTDFPCDWIYGTAKDRDAAAESWKSRVG